MCAERLGPQRPPARRRNGERGLSLVELMVGIVVSLLVGLAASGSAMVFTASQRQGIGTGTTSVNSTGVLNAIKADVSLAGLGFFDNSAALCTTLNLSMSTTKVSDGAAFAPMQATRLPFLRPALGMRLPTSSFMSAATRLSRQMATGSGCLALASSTRPRRQAGSQGLSQVRPRMPGNTLDTQLIM